MVPHKIYKSSSTTTLLRNVRNMHITYKHNERKFLVHGAENHSSNNEAVVSGINVENKDAANTFTVDKNTFLIKTLQKCMAQPQEILEPKKIVIDFSSPNIAKPFHAGHLRSTIIGNFIANVNRYFNNNVTRLNYLGDWGTQFGLLQYGLKAKSINVCQLQENPIRTLYDVYVYANKLSKTDESVQIGARKYFSDIEQGKSDLKNWKTIRETTVQELEKVYQRLGIHFDTFDWESDYNGEAIKDLMSSLEQKDIIKKDESGKKVVTINNRDVTILKSDSSTLYLSRDIAALLDRYKRFAFDKMLYVVDNAQSDHFSTLFNVVSRFNEKCSLKCEHIKFGRIKGMSTRQGNFVFLNDILDEAKRKMHEKQSISKSKDHFETSHYHIPTGHNII